MKLAIVCEYFHPENSGGTATDMSELAKYLRSQFEGVAVDVITSRNFYRTPGKPSDLPLAEKWMGINITRLRTPKSNRPSVPLRFLAGTCFSLAAFGRLMGRKDYDLLLVVTNPPTNALTGWLYKLFRGRDYVYFINDLYPDIAVALGSLSDSSPITRACRALQRRFLASASRVVVVGRCMRERVRRQYGIPNDRMAVIRNWADPDQIRPGPKENAFSRANQLTGFIVLYGGNFAQYIDFEQILEAAGLLAENRAVSFVLIGDGARRAQLERDIEKRHLGNIRVLPGVPRAKMGEVLAAADAALVPLSPSIMGLGSPGKLYTILAAGRPVLAMAPAASELACILHEEGCGIAVDCGDAAGLARAVLRMQEDPSLAADMGRRGRAALETRFTLRQAAEAFHALFAEAAQTPPACD